MINFNLQNIVKTSEIELIGLGLFGKTWQSQICLHLRSKKGEQLSRQTLFAWHDRDSLPITYKPELRKLAAIRLKQVRQAYDMLNDDQSTIEKSIALFLKENAQLFTACSSIYTRTFFGYDKYHNFNLRVELTLQKPEEGKYEHLQAVWNAYSFTKDNFYSELVELKENLLKFIQSHDAFFNEELSTPDSVRYKFDDINFCHLTCLKQHLSI